MVEKKIKNIDVIDCTLRDGEQAPGVCFTIAEKVELATQLSDAGVDVLDAGFPAASNSDMEAMQEIKRKKLKIKLAATARAVIQDIVASQNAGADEVFLFMPTSENRIANTLKMTFQQFKHTFRRAAEEVVSRNLTLNIVCEAATQTSYQSLVDVIEVLSYNLPIKRVILADSVGCATPESISKLFSHLRSYLDDSIDLCAHCHDDFGLATANTLAAVGAGANAVTCTVNGIGERAGNADLAQVAAALIYLYKKSINIDLKKMQELSYYVEKISGFCLPPNRAVTGFNVFRHESGIHVDCMLKDNGSYEYLPSKALGRETEFILGKHSGSALIKHILHQANIGYDNTLIEKILSFVKETISKRNKATLWTIIEQLRAFQFEHLSGIPNQFIIDFALKEDGKNR